MPDPLSIHGLRVGPLTAPAGRPAATGPHKTAEGQSFKDILLENLDQVNRLQQEAAKGVEKVLTGESQNLAEVFTAVRKSEVAFNMLMEMRNKLIDAYHEVEQMRI